MWLTGKLHRHIVQLQFSEATAVRQLEAAQKKLIRVEAQLLRTAQYVDEKDRTIYHNRLEARNKVHHLRHTIQVFCPYYQYYLIICLHLVLCVYLNELSFDVDGRYVNNCHLGSASQILWSCTTLRSGEIHGISYSSSGKSTKHRR